MYIIYIYILYERYKYLGKHKKKATIKRLKNNIISSFSVCLHNIMCTYILG